MNENATGLYKNEAKILDSTNEKQYPDDVAQNNSSSVELLISIRTGATKVVLIIVILLLLSILIVRIILNKKYKDNKVLKLVDKIIIAIMIIALVVIGLAIKTYADISITGLTPSYMGIDTYLNSSYTIGSDCSLAADYMSYPTIMCIEQCNISNAWEGPRKVVADINMVGPTRDGNSVGTLGELSDNDKKGVLILEYLGAFVEGVPYGDGRAGLCKNLLSTFMRSKGSEFTNITGLQMGHTPLGGPLKYSEYETSVEDAWNAAQNYANTGVSASTGDGIRKLDNTTKLKLKTVGGKSAFGAIYCVVPEESELFISTDGGTTYEPYGGDIITQDGRTVKFSSAECNQKKFYIPYEELEDYDFESVKIKVSGPGSGMQGKLVFFGHNYLGGQQQGVLRGKGEGGEVTVDIIYDIEEDTPGVVKYLYSENGTPVPDRSTMEEYAKRLEPYPTEPDGAARNPIRAPYRIACAAQRIPRSR